MTKRQLTVFLDEDVFRDVEAIAAENRVPMGLVVRRAVRAGIESPGLSPRPVIRPRNDTHPPFDGDAA